MLEEDASTSPSGSMPLLAQTYARRSSPSLEDASTSSLSSYDDLEISPYDVSRVEPLVRERVVRALDSRSEQEEPSSVATPLHRRTRRRTSAKGTQKRRLDEASVGDASLAFLGQRSGCEDLPNFQLSCMPLPNATVQQNQWFEFQWSDRNPLFNQVESVHIYLFDGDSGSTLGFWSPNKSQGSIQVLANDSFWGPDGYRFRAGHPTTYPFNFVIIPDTATVHRGETTEPTFFAVQTALPNSVLALQASSSQSVSSQSVQSTASLTSLAAAASSSSVIASQSSASISSSSRTQLPLSSSGIVTTITSGSSVLVSTVFPASTGTSIAGSDGGGGFPGWAIAVITVLGFLVLCAIIGGWFLVMRRIRRRREAEKRGSMGSASPMLQVPNDGNSTAPTSPTRAGLGGAGGTTGENASLLGGAALAGSHRRGTADEASMMSGSDTMLSGADAAIVADAFRQAMRKPDFSGRPVEEDESPGENAPTSSEGLLSEELRKEGTDLRNVSSARNFHLEDSPRPS